MSLSPDFIKELLAKDQKRVLGINTPQVGPLRYSDTASRCAKRQCVVSTHYSVQGVPYCTVHALEELNSMLVAQGFKGVTSRAVTKPTAIPAGRVIGASARAFLEVGWALGKFECIHSISLDKDCDYCADS